MFTILETERLLLRPPRAGDIGRFIPLIGDFEVSKNLSRVPHPYTEDDACDFMIQASVGWVTGRDLPFGIVRKEDGTYLGTCGVHPARGWEFGYWIGKPYWGKGYATEAVRRLIAYAFEVLKAEELRASWYHDNPASGRVLEKLGCQSDGNEERACLSRGTNVFCHKVVLRRSDYERRKDLP